MSRGLLLLLPLLPRGSMLAAHRDLGPVTTGLSNDCHDFPASPSPASPASPRLAPPRWSWRGVSPGGSCMESKDYRLPEDGWNARLCSSPAYLS
ncbi:uncharacterized protein LOC123507779 isoform X2 [Portunus trituberculatus]|uniref:uncharacterized protein LOC123507779 isoform X2 n=1 Tax=Portunus trituberculatus TaxID=210409 RepID=UPI001E1CCF87|nr:uncharacterized protein LOC123507779 isoform X2 [Portunus trituberculatus]